MLPWPPYFQPASVSNQQAAATGERLPFGLLDLFAVRGSPTARPELIAVLGCLGGGVLPVRVADTSSLPKAIQAQITTASVQLRDQFRVITAQELWVASIDAVDQVVDAAGLNDPAYLYGRLQGLIRFDIDHITVAAPDQAGCTIVGRLDLLDACARACATRFPLTEQGGFVYQLLLPLGSVHAARQGRALALCYPTLDPTHFTSPDNSVVLLRVAYELLARLQQDVRAELPDHPFANALLPVPSRQRLEADLIADGYRIQGDVAIRATPAGGQAGDTTSFLAQLRALARTWFAPQLRLPQQATPALYQTLIRELLPALFTPADRAMADALGQVVALDTVAAPEATHAGPPARSTAGVATTPLAVHSTTTVQPDLRDAPQPSPAGVRTDHWSGDFAPIPQAQPAATIRLDREEWARDVLAELGTPSAKPAPPSPRSSTWADDFATPPATTTASTPTDNDWLDDFA